MIFVLGLSQINAEEFEIKTSQEAVDKALQYTGFSKYNKINLDILKNETNVMTFSDSTTPFLAKQMDGRRVWKIQFKNISLKSKEQIEKDGFNPRDFDVYIDSISGKLYEMRSLAENIDRVMYPEVPATMAEEQMKNMFFEEYISLPEKKPNVSFINSLNNVTFSIENSKLVVVKYVIYSLRGRSLNNVWIIHLHGISEEPQYYYHMRSVINAEDGVGIQELNCPFPTNDYLKKIGWDKKK